MLFRSGRAEVTLDVPEFGVAPGQACVAFEGARLLGGGWIERDATRMAPYPAVHGSVALSA